MNKKYCFLILLLTLTFSFYSCETVCDCNKNLGCKILKLKNASGAVIMTKTFCSQTDYHTDTILQDSVKAFYSRYDPTRASTEERDSIYKYETVNDVKPKEIKSFENNGYSCFCAK